MKVWCKLENRKTKQGGRRAEQAVTDGAARREGTALLRSKGKGGSIMVGRGRWALGGARAKAKAKKDDDKISLSGLVEV